MIYNVKVKAIKNRTFAIEAESKEEAEASFTRLLNDDESFNIKEEMFKEDDIFDAIVVLDILAVDEIDYKERKLVDSEGNTALNQNEREQN